MSVEQSKQAMMSVERRAECESDSLCMMATYSQERCLELMRQAVKRYADKGITAVMDTDIMKVTLPNGSAVHYVVSKLSAQSDSAGARVSPYKCETDE